MRIRLMLRYSLFIVVLLASVSVVAAQAETCSPIVLRALDTLDNACSTLDRNSACYGYNSVSATLASTAPLDVQFAQPSDTINVADIATLQTAPLNEVADEWGLALLRVQATNIEGTLPGQSVVMLLMGDATLTRDGETPTDETLQDSMEAFYFTTGLGNPQCKTAPDSLIVQSPQGVRVNFTINGAEVELGSTAILSIVDEGGAFELTMAEGRAVINNEVVVPEGFWAKIPLDTETDLEFGGNFRAVSGDPLMCRMVPEENRAEFDAIFSALPVGVLQYAVDEIEYDDVGCQTPDGQPLPMITDTPAACVPTQPNGWQTYTIRSGETLFRIAQGSGSSIDELSRVNCIDNPAVIIAGTTLFVPRIPVIAVPPTAVPTAVPTEPIVTEEAKPTEETRATQEPNATQEVTVTEDPLTGN